MKLPFERVLLTIALLAAVSSAVGFRLAFLKSAKTGTATRKSIHLNIPYERHEMVPAAISEVKWTDPLHSAGAAKWTYDLFTPPEIFYDAVSKRFTVSPPRTTLGEDKTASDEPADPLIELLAVKPTLYRLQLIGYVGTKSGYLGLFENDASHETFLAAVSQNPAGLDLDIESFNVGLAPVALSEGGTRQPIATASVRDHATHQLVRLTTTERCYAKARAILRLDRGTPREVCAGDMLQLNGKDYEVGEVQLSPPRVALRRVPNGSAAGELLTLEMTTVAADGAASPSI